jgi:diguanylate cyclase (GGDEF)-like protein/PAS domain S-box-containing protein
MTSFGRAIHEPARAASRRAGDRAAHHREPGDPESSGAPGEQGLAWAEESLRWAEERYRAVTDRAPIGHAIVGLDDRWLSVNDALCEIVGYSREELLRRTVEDITHPDDVESQRPYVERLFGGEIHRYELEKRYVRPDGEVVWVRLTDALVRDASGKPIHFIAQVQDVTETKSAEQALRESEARYRTIAEQLPETAVVMYDRDLRFTMAAGPALGEAGWVREDIEGRTLAEVAAPEQRATLESLYRSALRGETRSLEYRSATSRHAFLLRLAPVRDSHGEITGGMALSLDIEQRTRAEDALRQSEEHYRLLADNSTDWITVHNPAGRYLYVSPACRELLRYEPEELLGSNPYDLVHPHDAPAVRATHDALLESSEPSTLTYRLRSKYGDYRWVETTSRSIRDPIIGEVRELQGTTRDVTRRMEAEARFRTAFEKAPIGMAMVGLDGRFMSVNETLCRILGYDRADLEGISVQDVTHHEDLEEAEAAARRLDSRETDSHRGEQRYVHREGRPVWVQLDLSIVRDAAGTPLHRLAQVQDITLRRDYEHELRRRADHDSLTGVPNRRRWDEELERELYRARRAGADLCVAVLDVDGFKPYNDTRGHQAGDRLLREAAGAWRSSLRATDVLARLGGDEFAVALPGTAEHDHGPIIDRLRRALPPEPTCSAGVASWNGIESAEALLERADQALYDAKRRGGDQTVLAARDVPGS